MLGREAARWLRSLGASFHHGPPRWPPLSLELASLGPGCPQQAANPAAARVAAALSAAAESTSKSLLGPLRGAEPAAVGRAAVAALETASELFGFSTLFHKSRKMRGVHGTFNPSIWRWYHRHGYWATRRKQLDFGTKRRYRYDQVQGDGKKAIGYEKRFGQFWMDKSYYKPIKNWCRF
eukprot:TRINITY_DN104136_c0_g1_i1.p1 TRINITY_DN104136_c0_g1~~TRINITY_DN104136_c0_g1_i1.p1  ORF type:complete len:199 (-),score=22.84 TRINITY_DN104136_c0_g1_i1:151-687(-)